jgi:hypothetical protein
VRGRWTGAVAMVGRRGSGDGEKVRGGRGVRGVRGMGMKWWGVVG